MTNSVPFNSAQTTRAPVIAGCPISVQVMNRELGSAPDGEGALDLPQAAEVVPSNGIVLMDVAAVFDPDSVGFQVGVEVAQTLGEGEFVSSNSTCPEYIKRG